MTQDEFVTWCAWLRRNPQGFHWQNWVQAHLAREVNRLIPRKKSDRMPKLDEFLYRPPLPITAERQRNEARAKRKKANQ
jgi:hypothetical protein